MVRCGLPVSDKEMTATLPPEVTYLGDEFTRDILVHLLGGDTIVFPIPKDEASGEYLRGQRLVVVPRNENDGTARSAAFFLRSLGIPCATSPVSIRWIVTDYALPFADSPERLKRLLCGAPVLTPSQPHLEPSQTGVQWLSGYQRTEFPHILDGLLPAGIVGGINAEGGAGKTYFLTSLFAAISCGLEWGPFRPTRPHKTLLLLAEDPVEIVRNRVFDCAIAGIPQSHHGLLGANFHAVSVRGSSGPLLGLKDGNPTPTEWADWLETTITAHPGLEILGLDPLRKFFGLEENRNEYAHAFIGLLEAISQRHGLTILYAHHVAKAARSEGVSSITGRGAGGFSDNCRWMSAMKPLDEDGFEALGLDGESHEYVEFIVNKSNYSPKLPRAVLLRRGEHGVLAPVSRESDARASYLAELLTDAQVTRRDLEKSVACADIRSAMKERFGGFRSCHLGTIVREGIRAGILEEVETKRGRVMQIVLRPTQVPF